MSAVLDTLRARGLPDAAATRYEALLQAAHEALTARGVAADAPRTELVVPGRVELVGKHVDYAGGRSLVCPIDRGIAAVAAPHPEPALVVVDVGRGETVTVPLAHLRLARALPRPGWRIYADAAVQRLAMNFGPLPQGVVVALHSTLPPAAGLSSSTAFTVTLALAVAEHNALTRDPRWAALAADPLRLAGYCSAIESGFDYGDLPGGHGVGTLSGTQDQCAILAGDAGMVHQFAYRPERHEGSVAWPADWALLVATSGVVAAKGGEAKDRYNRAARMTGHLVTQWNARGQQAATLRDVIATGVDFELLAAAADSDEFAEPVLRARLAQFDQECRLVVPTVARGIATADVAMVARGVAHSVAGAVWALENQLPETIALTQLAVSAGAWCASPFGAGFGGSVWALAPRAEASAIAEQWRAAYRNTGLTAAAQAEVFVTQPSPPAQWARAAQGR